MLQASWGQGAKQPTSPNRRIYPQTLKARFFLHLFLTFICNTDLTKLTLKYIQVIICYNFRACYIVKINAGARSFSKYAQDNFQYNFQDNFLPSESGFWFFLYRLLFSGVGNVWLSCRSNRPFRWRWWNLSQWTSLYCPLKRFMLLSYSPLKILMVL